MEEHLQRFVAQEYELNDLNNKYKCVQEIVNRSVHSLSANDESNLGPKNNVKDCIIAAAWLHDIARHANTQHDENSFISLRTRIVILLSRYFNENDTRLIVNVLRRLDSASEERETLMLLGARGLLVRDAVKKAVRSYEFRE